MRANPEYQWHFYCDEHRIEDYYEDADSVKAREAVANHNADSFHAKGVGAKVKRVRK